MRIGLDLDGVLYNFGDSCHRYLEATGRGDLWKSGPTPDPFWDFYKDWGWTSKEFVQFCNEGADAGFVFCGPTREGAVDAVRRIKRLGHQIIVITDRSFGSTPKVSQDNTLRWWKENRFPDFDEIHFTPDKTIVQTDMMVEDKLENYDALIKAGTDAYLINRAWNIVDGGDARKRINSIRDFAGIVEHVTKQGYVDLSFA
jgi:FMN phosphatase YigB (HAD superfamily)